MIIDTHAHYDDEAFDPDREVLLASMQEFLQMRASHSFQQMFLRILYR